MADGLLISKSYAPTDPELQGYYIDVELTSDGLPDFLLYNFDTRPYFLVDSETTYTTTQNSLTKKADGSILYEFSTYPTSGRLLQDSTFMKENIVRYDVNNRYADVLDEFADALKQSISDVHSWQYSVATANTELRTATSLDIFLNCAHFKVGNGLVGTNLQSPCTWKPFDEYTESVGAQNVKYPPVSFMIALLWVQDDIKNNKIQVSDALKNILNTDLDVNIPSQRKVDWFVNIDGEGSFSNITLTWTAPRADEVYSASCDLRVGDSPVVDNAFYLGRQTYDGQPITWSWEELYKKGANTADGIAKLKEMLSNKISTAFGANVYLFMQMNFFYGGVDEKSTLCYCNIDANGQAVAYGSYSSSGIKDGSTVTVTYKNTDDVYDDFDDDIDEDIDKNMYAVSALSLMTKSYVMSTSRLKQLGNFLWSADFADNILLLNNSPIMNIVSCKVFPFTVSGGSDTSIVLGNVNTGIYGQPIAENQNFIINVGSFTIPKYYNNWLDYSATTIGIFLPMCGFYSLDTESFMGKTLNVKYYIDVLTGTCKAVLSVNGIPVQEFGGQIGFDIPLTSQDRSQTELSQLTSLGGAISGALSLKSNPIGAIQSIGENVGNVVAPKDYFNTVGSLSPTCNMMTTHDVFLVIERPIVQYPSNYNHTYGKPCNLTLTLNKLNGFTQCSNVDVSTVPCTDREKDMIKSLLESGVYV